MYKQYKPVNESEASKLLRETGTWAWDSHNWVETNPGYATCGWCGKTHTSEMGIGPDYPLCVDNPRLSDLNAIEDLLQAFRTKDIRKKGR